MQLENAIKAAAEEYSCRIELWIMLQVELYQKAVF